MIFESTLSVYPIHTHSTITQYKIQYDNKTSYFTWNHLYNLDELESWQRQTRRQKALKWFSIGKCRSSYSGLNNVNGVMRRIDRIDKYRKKGRRGKGSKKITCVSFQWFSNIIQEEKRTTNSSYLLQRPGYIISLYFLIEAHRKQQ